MLPGEPATSLAAGKFGLEVYKLAKEQGWLDKLLNSLRKKHRILVLGSTGAGKTQFLQSLRSIAPSIISNLSRTQFVSKKQFEIEKELFTFIDTPGELLHEGRRKEAIRDALKTDIPGIINVVAYGYHEYKVGTDVVLDEQNRPKPEFLENQRQIEIDLLNEWTSTLGGGWIKALADYGRDEGRSLVGSSR